MDTPSAAPDLLDLALQLSLEWGPAWLQPIQGRLRARRPDVRAAQADELDVFARSTRDWAHRLIARTVRDGVPSEQVARQTIADALPWMGPSTFKLLWTQGVYYAMR
jgi:hypothetical protein